MKGDEYLSEESSAKTTERMSHKNISSSFLSQNFRINTPLSCFKNKKASEKILLPAAPFL